MDDSTMEVIKETLTKLRQEVAAAKSEAADLKEDLHNTKVKNGDAEFFLMRAREEKDKLSQELSQLQSTSDRLQGDKQKFAASINDELKKLLS